MTPASVGARAPVRLTAALGAALFVLAVVAGCSTSATRTEGAEAIDNSGLQVRSRCVYVKDYQLWLYTADLHISGSKTASSDGQVADGLRVSGLKLSGAIPEFSPYVSVITADRVARLSNSSPPTTTVNLDEARQVVGTYQEANCQDAATAGGGGVAGSLPAPAPAK
jgi:hypothetical protein